MASNSVRHREQGDKAAFSCPYEPHSSSGFDRQGDRTEWGRACSPTEGERRPFPGCSSDFREPPERVPEQPLLVDIAGAAELLNVCEETIRNLINRKVLSRIYLGAEHKRPSIMRFRRSDIETLANEGIPRQETIDEKP